MSNPSFFNIDRWLFELMEGNLSAEQVAQLEAFLIQHPELDVDRDMWELAKVDSQEIVYPNQEKLFRRKPVGLYMSLGFASIVLLLSIGVLNYQDQTVENVSYAEIQKNNNLPTFKLSNFKLSNFKLSNLQTFKPKSAFASNHPNFSETNRISEYINAAIPYSNDRNQVGVRDLSTLPIADSRSLMQNNRSSEQIITGSFTPEKAKQIGTKNIEKGIEKEIIFRKNSISGAQKYGGAVYKMSFSSKLSKFGRSVQRMMDNPVALKNMKDPYYHVPGMQAMDINFGSVGTMLATRVQTITRAQWLGAENQQFMNQLSIDGYSYGMRGGVGFQLNHNYYGQGGIENYNASMAYSPKISVTRNINLEPSIRFKMGTKLLNTDQIETGSLVEYERGNTQSFYSNGATPIGSSLWYKDLGLGLMVNTKWFFVGVQGDNLLRHYDNIYSNDLLNPRRAAKHFIATIGTDYTSKKENLTASPYFVYQQQELISEGWLGVNLRYQWLTIGGAVSSNLEPAASIGLKFDHFMLTYNADYLRSTMLNKNILSHQLTIRFLSKPSRIGQRLLNQ